MAQLIKNWDELDGLESENYRIIVEDLSGIKCSGWIRPKIETEETIENYCDHNIYLSTHTFYGHDYEYYTKVLQSFGFDVILDNWDKED